jgi:DNA repair protein RecN (Recombination protein N)
MLREIRIRNFALIRDLSIEFGRGLNLLTGETGSGKSILVDALGLLLGARSSQEMIRTGCESATIEGVFEIKPEGSVEAKLAEAGLDAPDHCVLIRREISSAGRSRIFVNSNLTNLSFLKSIGDTLGDIHGQQDQRSLLDLSTHLEWLDDFGGNGTLLGAVEDCYRSFQATARQIKSMESNEQERLRRIDVLQFQIEEIRNVDPKPDEKEELESERSLLANREKLMELSTEAYGILYENESSILRQATRLEKILEELERFDKSWGSQREALRESRYKLEDLSYQLRDYAASSDFSPERLEQVHHRLYALDKLIKRYGASCGEILEFRQVCEKELERLLAFEERSGRLSEQLDAELDLYRVDAEKLSAKRRQDARRLETEIEKEFKALSMDKMKLRVTFHPHEDTDHNGLFPGHYGLHGLDHVEFLIAPNQGEEARPLAKIASGGELSRLMLSIRSLCRDNEADRTFVFDEVDAGIGGRVAEAIGRRLKGISENNQVLCVTHLPQIAAFADQHFSVLKHAVGDRTETCVEPLDRTQRVSELSRMLGGETITQTVRDHAREMLQYSTGARKKD